MQHIAAALWDDLKKNKSLNKYSIKGTIES